MCLTNSACNLQKNILRFSQLSVWCDAVNVLHCLLKLVTNTKQVQRNSLCLSDPRYELGEGGGKWGPASGPGGLRHGWSVQLRYLVIEQGRRKPLFPVFPPGMDKKNKHHPSCMAASHLATELRQRIESASGLYTIFLIFE